MIYFQNNKICKTNTITTIISNTNIKDNFIIDEQSYDLLQKMTDPKIVVDEKTITFSDATINFKITKLDYPELKIPDQNNILFSHTYSTEELKQACIFLGDDNIFKGVLFDDAGGIYATNRFCVYYRNHNDNKLLWSVPKEAFKNIESKEVKISFSQSYAFIEDSNNLIISKLFAGTIPELKKIINLFEGEKFEFDKLAEFTWFNTNYIIAKNNKFIFTNGEEKSLEIDCKLNAEFKMQVSYFLKALSICDKHINAKYNASLVQFEDFLIICQCKCN